MHLILDAQKGSELRLILCGKKGGKLHIRHGELNDRNDLNQILYFIQKGN